VAAGKPVLTEKPLTETLASALDLAAALPADAPVMVAQTLRWSPALLAARGRMPEIGEVHRIRLAQRLEPNAILWQRDQAMAGAGSVTLTGVHVFDLLRWFAGATPERVSARCRTLLGHPFENLFDARFEFADRPLLGSCEVGKFSASRSQLLELVGTGGQLWVDYQQGRVELLHGAGRRLIAAPGDQPTLPPALTDFCRFVRGEIPCPVPLSAGVETLRMADACYRSDAADGALVRLDQ
jgi:predicted dehydrogenase